MDTKNSMSGARRILGVAMILTGIIGMAGQFAKGGSLRKEAGSDSIAVYAAAAPAQAAVEMPRIENAKVESRTVAGSLDATFRGIVAQAEQPEWLGYSVDQVAGNRGVCCGNYRDDGYCGTCRLEHDNDNGATTTTSQPGAGTIKLEGVRQLVVLFRLEGKSVKRIRMASEDCTLDAGGSPFVWLTGVKPADSVALLETYVRGGNFGERADHGLAHGALAAIALHADASADRALESFVKPDEREGLRRQAAFWLGAARGRAGFSLLQRMAKNDPSSEVRAHVTFALSVSHEPGALDEMIRMAHDDTSSRVRGQALFWLAQKAGQRAASTITGAIENDPDTDVKKKAVFALSQLPKDEGVPKLIEVAQTNRNPEVRKQAMFWLGQSHDPRALAFFEQVLSK
ncbi:MAG TPA: HEAT repeat domain-containing protein [Candidatus Acidoferrum sp.]|nr:HEAT repeat domain-containing protein [Candidatus Acidoferrum sp.]